VDYLASLEDGMGRGGGEARRGSVGVGEREGSGEGVGGGEGNSGNVFGVSAGVGGLGCWPKEGGRMRDGAEKKRS